MHNRQSRQTRRDKILQILPDPPAKRILFFCSLLGFILNLTQLHAQNSTPPASDCGKRDRPMRITLRHIEADGVAYDQGYTTLEGFITPIDPWRTDWIPFLDLRGHVFNNGKFAANAGLGFRYIGSSHVWGVNMYYDYRSTTRRHYNQLSWGFESLSRVWDFRLNGYLPFGKKTSSWYDNQFSNFTDHTLTFSHKREFGMGSVNAEVGLHVDNFKHVPLYFAAGPYYLHGRMKSAWGGELRARADIYEYLTLEANTSYDSAFRWIGQGQVSLNYYFGGKRQVKQGASRSCAQALTLATRALQRVDRNEIIPVDKRRKKVEAILPFSFIFVNNLSSSNGTWESPYPTLQQAQANSAPNDIIYVLPGSGAPYLLTNDSGFEMQSGQKLWGASVTHILNTQFGPVEIPALASVMPKVENVYSFGMSDVVTMANGCEVSGLHILGTNIDTGIIAQPSDTNANVSINRNLLQVSNTSNMETFGIIAEYSGTGTMIASITENQLFDIPSFTGGFITVANDVGGNVQTTIENNQCFSITTTMGSEFVPYGAFNSGAGNLSVTMSDNLCANLTIADSAKLFEADNAAAGQMIATIANNEATNISATNVLYAFYGLNESAGTMTVSIIDNTLSASSASNQQGVNVVNTLAGNICATIIGNNSGTGVNGISNLDGGVFKLDPSSAGNTPSLIPNGTITPGSCP